MIQELYEMAEDIRDTETSAAASASLKMEGDESQVGQETDWYLGSAFNVVETGERDEADSVRDGQEHLPRWLRTAQVAEERSMGREHDNDMGELSENELAMSGGRLGIDHILKALSSEKGRDVVSTEYCQVKCHVT